MGIVEAVGREVTNISVGDRVVDPLQHLVRPLLDVHRRPAVAVRDDAGPRARHRCRPARLHQALRPGRRRPGRVPASAAGAVRPDQGSRRPARRAVPLPVRCAADRVAGRRVRATSPTGGSVAVHRPRARSGRCAPASPRTVAREVFGVDLVPERLEMARRHGIETIDLARTRRPRRRAARAAPMVAARLRDRRRRHGGARIAGRQGVQAFVGTPARRRRRAR